MPYRTTLVSLHCRSPRSAPPSADISFLWLHHPCSMRVPHFYKVGPVSRSALPSLLSTALQAITATVSQSERWLDFYFNVPWHRCPCLGELGLPWRPWPREREKTRESTTNVSYYAALTSGDIWQSLCESYNRVAVWASNQCIVWALEDRERGWGGGIVTLVQHSGDFGTDWWEKKSGALRFNSSKDRCVWTGWLHSLGYPNSAPIPGSFESDPMFYLCLHLKAHSPMGLFLTIFFYQTVKNNKTQAYVDSPRPLASYSTNVSFRANTFRARVNKRWVTRHNLHTDRHWLDFNNTDIKVRQGWIYCIF